MQKKSHACSSITKSTERHPHRLHNTFTSILKCWHGPRSTPQIYFVCINQPAGKFLHGNRREVEVEALLLGERTDLNLPSTRKNVLKMLICLWGLDGPNVVRCAPLKQPWKRLRNFDLKWRTHCTCVWEFYLWTAGRSGWNEWAAEMHFCNNIRANPAWVLGWNWHTKDSRQSSQSVIKLVFSLEG